MIKILISIIIVFILLIPLTKAGNEIIAYMATTIYNDCNGQDIDVTPLGLHYIANQTPIPVIEWPYDIYLIGEVSRLIIEKEPYGLSIPNVAGIGASGNGTVLLRCGDKELVANFYTYKWAGQRLDPFYYNFQQIIQTVSNVTTEKIGDIVAGIESNISIQKTEGERGVINTGSGNQISTGDYSPIIYIVATVSVVISISVYVIFEFIIKPQISKRRKLKESKGASPQVSFG